MVLDPLAVAGQVAWVAVAILVMEETSVATVLVNTTAVLMALMSWVMTVVMGEVVLATQGKAMAIVVMGGAILGVARTAIEIKDMENTLQWQ